jgi:hypothetical protein
LAFQTPDPLGLGLSQLAHKALHRLIGISELFSPTKSW